MAAQVLAESGVAVTVVEHRASVGRKFLLAGRGGLNITHSEPTAALLDRYGAATAWLTAAIEAFDANALRSWCADLGQPTFVGSSGRVFPEAFRATPLLRAWLRRLADLGVVIETRTRWTGWGDNGTLRVIDSDGSERSIGADVVVFALGGASWPRVGSDGGWVELFRKHSIEVTPLVAANCGVVVEWTQTFVDRFAGTPLKNVAVVVGDRAVRGDPVVTSSGLEAGPVYAHSAALRLDGAQMTIDLFPDLPVEKIADRFAKKQRPKDSLSTWMRRCAMTDVGLGLVREATGNAVPRDPAGLAELAKAVPVTVEGPMPIERAISTAGGIAVTELDESFMLRAMPGTFAVGEMLDWEVPTGGYLLQACFSTAVTAAQSAITRLAL